MRNMKQLLFIVLISMLSCECGELIQNGIDFGNDAYCDAQYRGIAYKGILKKALNGDIKAIKEFSVIDFDGSYAYDHGINLLMLICYVGDDTIYQSLSLMNKDEREKFFLYVRLGASYIPRKDVLEYEFMNGIRCDTIEGFDFGVIYSDVQKRFPKTFKYYVD